MTKLVLDRNAIRRSSQMNSAANTQADFVLIDTFFVEMLKNQDRWSETYRRDLMALAPFSERLHVSMSVGEALRIELSEQRAITAEDLLPREFEILLAEMLHDVEKDRPSPLLLKKIEAILPALRAEQPLLEAPKIHTDELANKLTGLLKSETITGLRNGAVTLADKLNLTEAIAYRAYEAYCLAQGMTALPNPASLLSRHFIVAVWRALTWIQLGGLASAKPTKIFNDSYDDEYILLGSYFDGIVSAEVRLNEAYSALAAISAR